MRRIGLNANALKLVAVLAMVLDHVATVFLPPGSAAYFILRAEGRLAAPIMCFFIAEGYHHTSNIKKYLIRLFFMAVISHLPHALAFRMPLWEAYRATSVMWCLFLGLAAICLLKTNTLPLPVRLAAVGACCLMAYPGDWNYIAVLWILAFGIFRGSETKKWIAYIAVSAVYVLQFFIYGSDSTVALRFFVLAAIPLLRTYDGTLGKKSALIHWGYYLIYPLHLSVIYIVSLFI